MATDIDQNLPRVAITYCTQCRWMLRAAYFGQELLSTFGTTIGEIALVPATGGIFTVDVVSRSNEGDRVDGAADAARDIPAADAHLALRRTRIWDRKADGGFPEAKILKQRLRDIVEPERGLGHSDTTSRRKTVDPAARMTEIPASVEATSQTTGDCTDCA